MGKTVIGFDAKRVVRNGTGLGNYGRTLVNDLARVAPADWQLLLYAPDGGRDSLRQQVKETERLRFVYPQHRPLKLQRSLWRIGGIVDDLRRDGVSLYHGLTGELPRGLRRAGIRSVVTIHDLIFMRHPEYYHWIDRQIYEWKFRVACREADRVIAISERTKEDVMALGGVSADRIDVIYQSCSPRFAETVAQAQMEAVRNRYGLSGRLVLSVGSIEERKNILLAVKALRHLPEDIPLGVAVGRQTTYSQQVLREAAAAGLAQRVHFLHGVPDGDLQALYQMAEVFVYPSALRRVRHSYHRGDTQRSACSGCHGVVLRKRRAVPTAYTSPLTTTGRWPLPSGSCCTGLLGAKSASGAAASMYAASRGPTWQVR